LLEELHAVARRRPSCRVDVTGRAFLLVQPRRLAPHRVVKVNYRHLPFPIPSPSSFIRCLRGGDDRVTRQHHSRPPCTSSPAAIKARDAAVPPNLPCRRTCLHARHLHADQPLLEDLPHPSQLLRRTTGLATNSHSHRDPTAIRPRSYSLLHDHLVI